MSTNIASKLRHVLFPSADHERDWIVGDSGAGEQIIFWNIALGTQPTEVSLDAITDQQVVNAMALRFAQAAKAAATSSIDIGSAITGDKMERIVRALVLMILDEFNAHAIKTNAILTAIDNASTLAQLKTAVLAIPDYPQRTAAQLVTAIKTQIAATPE